MTKLINLLIVLSLICISNAQNAQDFDLIFPPGTDQINCEEGGVDCETLRILVIDPAHDFKVDCKSNKCKYSVFHIRWTQDGDREIWGHTFQGSGSGHGVTVVYETTGDGKLLVEKIDCQGDCRNAAFKFNGNARFNHDPDFNLDCSEDSCIQCTVKIPITGGTVSCSDVSVISGGDGGFTVADGSDGGDGGDGSVVVEPEEVEEEVVEPPEGGADHVYDYEFYGVDKVECEEDKIDCRNKKILVTDPSDGWKLDCKKNQDGHSEGYCFGLEITVIWTGTAGQDRQIYGAQCQGYRSCQGMVCLYMAVDGGTLWLDKTDCGDDLSCENVMFAYDGDVQYSDDFQFVCSGGIEACDGCMIFDNKEDEETCLSIAS